MSVAFAQQNLTGHGNWGASAALTIASGVITAIGPGVYVLTSEAGATDDLTRINGLSAYHEVVLFAASGHTITIKQGPYIKCKYDFVMTGDDNITLICKGSNVCVMKGGPSDNE